MFEQVSGDLREMIKALEIPVSGDALETSFELIDLLTAQVLEVVGAFDASEVWRAEGLPRRRRGCGNGPGSRGATPPGVRRRRGGCGICR